MAFAAQAGFARWPSSGAACRFQCATWSGCRAQGHSFSRPSMAKFADFLLWLHRSLGFRLSSIRSSRLMLSYRFTLSFGPSSTPFGCLPLAGLFALLLGPLRCFFASYLPRRSHRSVRLLSARLSRWFSHCFSFVRGDACLSFVFTFIAKCESLLLPSLAPSWLYLCPTLQLVSTYVLCFAQLVPSAFS